ncbi:MAG: N-acetyltransferase [Cyanobacteria bacterium QS_7_48_42]|nr:MAG: N-acetyltransferase [Cyanobacteria bacterium QH_2_48_84]PSO99324.1 MAG: N-acetyltransferase [Cyanobacteria bacterium QS_7_48_42]
MMIRDAIEADWDAVIKIYNEAIPEQMATADTEPVALENCLAWFQQHTPTRRPLWVMELEGVIAGWLSFRSFYGRTAYYPTAEISLYVSPFYRRQGVGRQLLQQALSQSPALGLRTLVGFIFAHNQPSLRLFQQLGFTQWGYLPLVAELDGKERDLVIVGHRVSS